MHRIMLAAAMAATMGTLAACGNSSSGSAGAAPSTGAVQAQNEQVEVLHSAQRAVEALRADANLGPSVADHLGRARGVLVFPNLVKAGFFFGAGGGQGVLLVKQGQGWSDPVFVYAADASFGLQIGLEGGQVLFTIMNDGALQKLLNGNANLGGDVSVAVGPWGGGLQGATTPNVGADLIAFSLQQGAFAGVAIKGGLVAPRQAFNDAYYGPGATPDRIIHAAYSRPEDRGLKTALSTVPARRTGSMR
jgi:lipid-binding SYLF domain-containing protein